MTIWGPGLRLGLGIPRDEYLGMSVPDLVDHQDWYLDREKGRADG